MIFNSFSVVLLAQNIKMSRFAQQVLDLALKEAAAVASSTTAGPPTGTPDVSAPALGPDCVPSQWYDVSF